MTSVTQTSLRPRFIGSEIYRSSSYGPRHPLSIPRVSTVIDLSRALGWLPDEVYIDSPRASVAELSRFHDPGYIAAVQLAEQTQSVTPDLRQRYNLGCNGNPVFGEMFRRPATACGGSLLGARLLTEPGVVYNPAGGTHHGRRDRASGFCYFNDPVLALLQLLDQGLERVLYLDVDAHHGDGVQVALSHDPRVLLISLHEAGRWPMQRGDGSSATVEDGSPEDHGEGRAWNFALPEGLNDSEMDLLMTTAVGPLARDFAPQAVVLQCGADALAEDPLSRLALSNGALWRAVALAMTFSDRLLVLGGGGYNPWSVARCWTGVWATLNGFALPHRLPPMAEAVLRSLSWRHSRARSAPEAWFTTLADPPNEGRIRDSVRETIGRALAKRP